MPLLLLYCSVTVQSWIAQPHKVAASITPSIIPGALTSPAFPSPSILLRPPPPSRHLKTLERRSQDQRPLPPRRSHLQLATLSWLNWDPAPNCCLFWPFRAVYQPSIPAVTPKAFSVRRRTHPWLSCPAITEVVSGLLSLRSSYLPTASLCSFRAPAPPESGHLSCSPSLS